MCATSFSKMAEGPWVLTGGEDILSSPFSEHLEGLNDSPCPHRDHSVCHATETAFVVKA